MKKILKLQVCFAVFLAAAPLAAKAQTTFFSDNFTTGSTLNQPVTPPTGNSTAYQTYIGLSGAGTTSTIAPHNLSITFPNTGSVLGEFVGLFTNTPVPLTAVGDYIAINVVFVNASNILLNTSGNSTLNIGLFNSGGVAPNQGNITLNTGSTTGGTQDWIGYVGRVFESGKPNVFTRPTQNPSGNTSQNQDLLFSGASSTQAFNNPNGTTVGSANATTNLTGSFVNGSTYTMQFVITFNSATSLSISNAVYAGSGTGGTMIFSMSQVATNATFLTGGFDGLAVGWRNSTAASQASIMDVTSIQIYGHSTPVTGPPNIITQPVSANVPTGAACAFSVSAIGFGTSYQWHRNGTNLLDGGNISGSTKSLLIISPAGATDVAPSNNVNGYYVTVSGTGGYSTNSVTNALALTTATNLIWTDFYNNNWDLANTANWMDTNNNPTVFNYGDPVLFNDYAGGGVVTMIDNFLSAPSVTVNSTKTYNFDSGSSGSFAGPGNLIYIGTGGLTVGNVNTYTGGTIISNASALLLLNNLNGLGTGPVTLAGGKIEVGPAGGASYSIPNDFVVANDFTVQFDGTGSYAGDFSGNFAGTAGKTLTFTVPSVNTTTNERVRMYGEGTTLNANLALNSSMITLAPYNGSSNQTYNGIISGAGGLIQRGGGSTILNNTNTYSGGTTPSAGNIGFGTNTIGTVTSGPIGTGPLYLAPEVPNLAGSGTVFAFGGARTIANAIQNPSATNNLTLIIGGTNDLTFSGPFTLYGNDGLGTNNVRYLQITNKAVTTFSGVISDSTNSVSEGFGLSINGNGTNTIGPLVLSANETYTGPTIITNCTLFVNGQLAAASAVTVNSNANLSGTGTIYGPVAINFGGALAPGAVASIGTLTINSNLTLAGNVKVRVSHPTTSDEAVVSGGITNTGTGTVTVTTLGSAPQNGDIFHLFSHAVTNGNALTVTGAGLVWTNKLGIDGTIVAGSVASTVATNSTNITFSVNYSGGVPVSLALSWPSDHTGWTLLAETNSLAVGLTNNWAPVAGSTAVNSMTIPINNTNGAVFFRMAYPYP